MRKSQQEVPWAEIKVENFWRPARKSVQGLAMLGPGGILRSLPQTQANIGRSRKTHGWNYWHHGVQENAAAGHTIPSDTHDSASPAWWEKIGKGLPMEDAMEQDFSDFALTWAGLIGLNGYRQCFREKSNNMEFLQGEIKDSVARRDASARLPRCHFTVETCIKVEALQLPMVPGSLIRMVT